MTDTTRDRTAGAGADRVTAPEADWDTAPGLLDGAMKLTLGPEDCDLAYWITSVAQGTLRDRGVTGHHEDAGVPELLTRPGPLNEALTLEFGFRSVAEEIATRLLGHYVARAPGIPEMEFYATQMIDEARHSRVFRNHLVELGRPAATLLRDIDEMAADYRRRVLRPVEEFTLEVIRDEGDFLGGVAVFAIVIEGVLAPAAELSERKWTPLSPATGEISRGTAIDEIRHLTVASTILRDRLREHPEERQRVLDVIGRGVRLWDEIPDREFVIHREELFQEGMEEHADLIGDHEIWPGVRMLDTTAEQRYAMAERWTDEMAETRMAYMELPVDVLTGGPGRSA
ncbi:VlmB-like protein [Streptomyces sp. NBC_01264]|uniref:VlmB-like protein n=1 Tax=Streptomyces sp. NBC_01264 TaxID=2903804 RepID=UPI00224DD0A5|nr:VlmB-like protein [Streptomyces sp. NBC_01264]MCX4782645.1 VlmB-like protein [Streptomyces sp. NBC_01264]